jgi:hypothetical protein
MSMFPDEDLNLEEDADPADEQTEDRGDALDPEVTKDNLKAIVGEQVEEETEEEEESEEPKGTPIPYGRFKTVNDRNKKLEEEIAALRAAAPVTKTEPAPVVERPAVKEEPAIDLKALRLEAADALQEGDNEKYNELQEKIEAAIEERATNRIRLEIKSDNAKAQAQNAVAETASEALSLYPFLDDTKGSTTANPDAIEDVKVYRDKFIREGKPFAEALKMAVAIIGPRYAPADEEDEETGEKKPVSDARKVVAITRNARAAAAQPASAQVGIGNRSGASKLNLEGLSEEEYDKVPMSEKKKQRGD